MKYDGQSHIPLPVRTSNSRKTKDKSKDTSDDKSVGVLGAIVVTGHLLKVADDDDNDKTQKELDAEKEKSDPVKEPAERPPTDGEQENAQKDGLKQQLEKEKMLRSEAEAQLREVHLECERCKVRLKSLQDDFNKMEEMVCNMLQFKSRIEQLKHEKSSISLAYENKIRKFQSCIASLEKENFMLLNELRTLQTQKDKDHQEEWEHSLSWLLLERLRLLEQENSSLVLENEQQRLQYEHCLDDVANQVVQALLTQKSLREECNKLQRRVQDLERQNHTLTLMFKQCLFHTTGNSGNEQLEYDSQNRWQKFLYSESKEELLLENSLQVQKNLHQHANHDSPSHNSQSEDSTESLASMCSDYSTHSGSSGGNPLMSYPGLPKMSSPPQWLKERSIYDKKGKTFTNISSTSYIKSPSCPPNKYGHLRSKLSEQDVLNSHVLESEKIEYSSIFPLCDRTQCKSMKEEISYTPFSVKVHESDNPSGDQEWARCSKIDVSRKTISHNDIGSLDAMETPMDDCLNVESLSLISSSQKLLVSSQYKPNNNLISQSYTEMEGYDHQNETKQQNINIPSTVTVNENFKNSAGQNCVYRTKSSISVPTVVATSISVPRPTTLNIIPHVMGDPAHNFSFPALECKSHILNECGNVYEDIDAPLFPEISQYNNISETDIKQFDNENLLSHIGSSSEESETAMNTVIRKPHTTSITNEINCQSTNTQSNEQQHLRIPARELPPTPINDFDCENTSDKNQDWINVNHIFVLQTCMTSPIETPATNHVTFSMSSIDTIQENNSPLSIISEHGNKDEGYSTMSSDVQEITSDCVPHIRQCVSPLPINSLNNITEKSVLDSTETVIFSTENNLNSQKSIIQNLQPLSEEEIEEGREEEEIYSGFERDLDSSLIRNEKCNLAVKNDCDENEMKIIDQTNNCNDECKIQNTCNNSSIETCTNSINEEIVETTLNHSIKSRILPTYDKILTLLTPQGFKSHRNDPRHITLPFIQYSKTIADSTYPPKQRTQTAEKATITEPDSSNILKSELLNNSSLSLTSLDNTDKHKIVKNIFENKDNIYFNHKDIRNSTVSDSCIVYEEINIRPKSITNSEDIEMYKLKNRFCKRHHRHHHHHHHHYYQNDYECFCQDQKSVQGFKDVLCNGKLARTLSDSHLFIREYYNPTYELTKLTSVGIKHPAKRFNLIPLECHTSACDLSSPSRLTPPLRRSQRQVLISEIQPSEKHQQDILINQEEIWKKKSQCSPTISLSSIHSSTSGEIGCADDDDELGATSLKCSRDPDLSSESEDECDLLEHHSFVQEWLQREDSQPSTAQVDYTYDDEEIGNWSLQLPTADVRNIENSNEIWENQWNHSQDTTFPEKSYIHQLEKIQETNLEDEYQDDYWNPTLWNSNEIQSSVQLDKTCDNFTKNKIETSDIKNEINSIIEDKLNGDILSNSDLMNNIENNDRNDSVTLKKYDFQENLPITISCTDTVKDECCNNIIPEEKNDYNSLQCEATEFNRDFYRLCMVGSTRSLVTSECGSLTGSHTETEQSSDNIIEHNEPQIILPDPESKVLISDKEVALSEKSLNVENKIENEPILDAAISDELKCQNKEIIEKEKNRKEIKNKIPPAIPPKKKLQISKITNVKSDQNCLGHQYSKITIDKLYLHERTKLNAASRRQTPDRRKKNSSRILYTSKTKTQDQAKHSEDHFKKLHKDSLNNSSVKKTIVEKKVYRQISKDPHKQMINNPNVLTTSTVEKSKLIKFSEDKEKSEIRLKNRILKNTSQSKSKSVKLNEISGLSEKDNFDLEKRLAGEGGHMSVAAKIQELNALIKNETEKSGTTVQKTKPKKIILEEKRDLSLEKKKEIQLKESTIVKKSSIKEGCGTSWVHVEADIDLSDPKARANLLDSMMASSSSSNSETEEEGEDEVLEHKHHQRLHALHRFRRHKKRATDKDAVISFIPRIRASIIDRHDFYYRYGEKEREAVACFDFLDDMSTSPSDVGSCEFLGRESIENNNNINQKTYSCPDNTIKPSRLSLDDTKLSCNRRHLRENHLSTTTLNSQDGEIIDHISLSDSCAESYSSSTHSLNHIL